MKARHCKLKSESIGSCSWLMAHGKITEYGIKVVNQNHETSRFPTSGSRVPVSVKIGLPRIHEKKRSFHE